MKLHRREVLATAAGGLLFAAARPLAAETRAGHAVLLGDSVFDNKVYVGEDPAVIEQLRAVLPRPWKASLLAVDGNVCADIPRQVARIPADASHLILSIGGNDALREQARLAQAVASVGEAVSVLSEIRQRFAAAYGAALAAVLAENKPTACCTIYDPRFPDATRQRVAVAALGVFNDIITRAAFRHGLPLIDLRLLMNEDGHYANPIEPSARGGERICATIRRIVLEHDFGRRQSVVYA
jgi:hypothetical protein